MSLFIHFTVSNVRKWDTKVLQIYQEWNIKYSPRDSLEIAITVKQLKWFYAKKVKQKKHFIKTGSISLKSDSKSVTLDPFFTIHYMRHQINNGCCADFNFFLSRLTLAMIQYNLPLLFTLKKKILTRLDAFHFWSTNKEKRRLREASASILWDLIKLSIIRWLDKVGRARSLRLAVGRLSFNNRGFARHTL